MYVDCTTQKAGGDAGVVRDKRKFNAPRQVVEEKKQKVEEEGGPSVLASNGHIHIYSESPMSASVEELRQSSIAEEADTEAHHREFGNDITNTQGRRRKRKLLPTVVLQNGGGHSNGHEDMPPGLEHTAKALFQGDSPTHCKPSALEKERPEVLLREAPAPASAVEVHHLQDGINNSSFQLRSTKLKYDHGQGGIGHGQENEAQPLFKFASGKQFQVSRAAKVRAEALINGVADDSTNSPVVQEGSDKLKTHQGNSRPPSIAKQILYQILGKSPSPELEHVKIGSGQQNMVVPLFQFASGKQFQPSSAAKARAEALVQGEVSGDSSSGCLVGDESETIKTKWKPSLPTVGGQESGQRVHPSRIGHVGMNSGLVDSLSLPTCSGQYPGQTVCASGVGHADMNSGRVNSSRLPTCSGQQPDQMMGSPLQVKHVDDGQKAQPLFQSASGKHFNTLLAGKTGVKTLLQEVPDDCIAVHLVQERTDIPQSQQCSQQVPPIAGQRLGKGVCSPQSSHGAMHSVEDNVAQPLFQFASGKHFKPSAAGKARAEALLRDGGNDGCEVPATQDASIGDGCLVPKESRSGEHLLYSADRKRMKTSILGGGRFPKDVELVYAEQENCTQPVFTAGKENAVPHKKTGRPKLNFRPPLRTRDNIKNIENGHACPNTGQGVPVLVPAGKENGHVEANAIQLDDPFLWNDAFLSDDVLLSDPGLLSCLEGVSSKPSSNPWRSRLSLNARKPKTGGSCILNVVMDEEDLAQPLLQWKAVAASKARVDALRRSAPEHKIPYFVKNQ